MRRFLVCAILSFLTISVDKQSSYLNPIRSVISVVVSPVHYFVDFQVATISFAVGREVPMLTLAQNAGTGIKYVEQVYYHHEAESKATWNILNKNRDFTKKNERFKNEPFLPLEEVPVRV